MQPAPGYAGNISGRCQHVAMRPALKAGLLPLWRDRDTLQFGVDPRRAVALRGLGHAAAVVSLLDGSRDRGALSLRPRRRTGSRPRRPTVCCARWPRPGCSTTSRPGCTPRCPSELRARLARNWPPRRWRTRTGTAGAGRWRRRQGAFIRVHGAGRTGASVAGLAAPPPAWATSAAPTRAGRAGGPGAGRAGAGRPGPAAAGGAARAIERVAPEVQDRATTGPRRTWWS